MRDETTTDTTGPAAEYVEPVDTDAVVEAWFVETFHNRGIDTPAFNHYRAAADALKARLRKRS